MLVYGSKEYFELVAEQGAGAVKEEMDFQKKMRAMEREPGPSFFDSILNSFSGAIKVYGQGQQLTAQREMQKIQADLARMRIQQGMTGAGVGPSVGGINWLTILAFGGVGLLTLLMFRN